MRISRLDVKRNKDRFREVDNMKIGTDIEIWIKRER